MNDHQLAQKLAEEAGHLLLEIRQTSGIEGKELGKQGDRKSDDFILSELKKFRPEDAVLSEESEDDSLRLKASRIWIVDPLDGTREYGEIPRDDWAVHVALYENDQLTAGAVSLPAQNKVFNTQPLNEIPDHSGQIRIAASRSRAPKIVEEVAESLGAVVVPMGSAGAKAMSIILGQTDVYLHAGGQYEWDSAAPAVVAMAHGLHASEIDGSPLLYNQPNPKKDNLLICRQELAEPVITAVKKAGY